MKFFSNIFLIFLLTSCANMVAPIGGDKDVYAPKLLNAGIIESPKKAYGKTIKFEFDEYIQLNKWEENFYISPPIKKRIQKKIKGQELFVIIDDTLNKNTTYFVALNLCIKDNNEGNILDTLGYKLSITDSFDTLTLSGDLRDSYTLEPLENAWVMLFNTNVNDTLIFKQTPNYIAKTAKNGSFYFPNLKDVNYKIVALTDFDFVYNLEEKIAFSDNLINAKNDSFISLFAFDPIIEIDGILTDSIGIKLDSLTTISVDLDSIIKKEGLPAGKLEIFTSQNAPCILQLLQNEKVITEIPFNKKPYLIDEIIPGTYHLRYITDNNRDSIWNTGNWERRIQPEKAVNYYSEITIRSNWDLEIEWIIVE